MNNTYAKFCPNVFVVKSAEKYSKGDVVTLTSKYGKETEVVIHNLVKQIGETFFYSFTRKDGENSQTYAVKKAERYQGYANNALKRSQQYCEAANEGHEFLQLAEPIKVGHHSEKRHRALIERNNKRMEKAVEEANKAESYDDRIEYWQRMADKIDLSMPASLEFFSSELEKAKAKHQELKNNPEKREHPCSLTYAKKAVNDLEKKVKLAQVLWG
ncbi:DUF3560 domain-containing protein [Pasteurella multocida]|uniref:DUF3560 domain-containing protein n=1 Tax=Pasteurella multocida TaxID=747 RepID=UPI002A4FD419|nr:DUF3560 domain-containing protein [Pasteurella multocida]MDY0489404.1 DUF3560 domain-containing protein [Pasteurella multocida]MDY0595904.1 DUF3560 domain-containing protein [Pasteurella multocida]MDY0665305.1 DUF3560 domain-containing protein [Pasteurella multocida]